MASSAAAPTRHTVAQTVFASLNPKHFSIHQRIRQFFPGGIIDALNRRAGNVHVFRASFLRVFFRIDQADRFIFIDRHLHNAVIILGCIQRAVSIVFRKAANTSPFKRSGHFIHLVLSAEAARYPRRLRNRSQVLQLTIDLIKPCLQRCALLFKRFFLRGRGINTRKTTA